MTAINKQNLCKSHYADHICINNLSSWLFTEHKIHIQYRPIIKNKAGLLNSKDNYR